MTTSSAPEAGRRCASSSRHLTVWPGGWNQGHNHHRRGDAYMDAYAGGTGVSYGTLSQAGLVPAEGRACAGPEQEGRPERPVAGRPRARATGLVGPERWPGPEPSRHHLQGALVEGLDLTLRASRSQRLYRDRNDRDLTVKRSPFAKQVFMSQNSMNHFKQKDVN